MFQLPTEIINQIYEYDITKRLYYDKVLKEFKNINQELYNQSTKNMCFLTSSNYIQDWDKWSGEIYRMNIFIKYLQNKKTLPYQIKRFTIESFKHFIRHVKEKYNLEDEIHYKQILSSINDNKCLCGSCYYSSDEDEEDTDEET